MLIFLQYLSCIFYPFLTLVYFCSWVFFIAGLDTDKGNNLGNFKNFVFAEGKGTPDQN